jgi:hypothetical protein
VSRHMMGVSSYPVAVLVEGKDRDGVLATS